jgi:hypothetical protein
MFPFDKKVTVIAKTIMGRRPKRPEASELGLSEVELRPSTASVLLRLTTAQGKFSRRYLARLDHLSAEIIKELDRVFEFEYETLFHLDLGDARLFIDVLDKVSPGFHACHIYPIANVGERIPVREQGIAEEIRPCP